MLDFLRSVVPWLNLGPRTEARKRGLRRKFGYGSELNSKPSPNLQVKKRESFEFESSPLLQNDEVEEKNGTKLKILTRKEFAASRLLSKRKNGAIVEYEDVAHGDVEIIHGSYVRVLSYNAKNE